MNCGNCKHWIDHRMHEWEGKVSDMTSYFSGWVKDELPGNYGLCCNPSDSKMVAICDGEGILGSLLTHESFGCTEFKDKSI